MSEEPPAKRRKTTSHDDVPAPPPAHEDIAAPISAQLEAAQKAIKPKRPRKRLVLNEDDEPSQPTSTADVDDSFISGLELKKKGVKVSKKIVPTPVVEVEVVEKEKAVVANGRPKRFASADAAVKVVDALEEEAVPVDKKRRVVEPENKAKKGRKKPVVVQEVEVDAEMEVESRALPKAKPRAPVKRVTKRKAQAEIVETVDLLVEVPVLEAAATTQAVPSPQEDAKVQDFAPTKKAPRKSKKGAAATAAYRRGAAARRNTGDAGCLRPLCTSESTACEKGVEKANQT